MFKMNHIAISVSDFEVSSNFYKKLGFKPFKYFESEDKNMIIGMFKLEDMKLEIFCFKNYQGLPESATSTATDLPIVGAKHFALGVKSIEEAKTFFETNNNINQEIKITLGKLGKKYFFIKDPDGILVEVIEQD